MASTLLKTVANFETSITAKLTAAGTSLTLTSNLDKDGNTIPGGTYAFTLDEGKTNEEHVIGTLSGSTLTITARNVSRIDGTTAQTGKEHRKGASIKITNHPVLVRMVRVLQGTDSLDGTNPLKYDSHPSFSANTQIPDKKYVDDAITAGAPDASTTTKGIAKASVAPASPTQPIFVGDNDPRVPTQNENDALVGTSGSAVSGSNKLVDNADTGTSGNNKVLRLDGAGKLPALDGSQLINLPPMLFKSGVASRAGDAASGTQTIAHGLGKIPKYVRIRADKAFSSTQFAVSQGVYNGTNVSTVFSTSVAAGGTDTTNIIAIYDNNAQTISQVATITVDATNITLTWTKSNTPNANNINLLWEAYA